MSSRKVAGNRGHFEQVHPDIADDEPVAARRDLLRTQAVVLRLEERVAALEASLPQKSPGVKK